MQLCCGLVLRFISFSIFSWGINWKELFNRKISRSISLCRYMVRVFVCCGIKFSLIDAGIEGTIILRSDMSDGTLLVLVTSTMSVC